MDIIQDLNACSQGMQQHVASNVVRGHGRHQKPAADLRLSKLTVGDISGCALASSGRVMSRPHTDAYMLADDDIYYQRGRRPTC